jgi:glucose/arabinose dehydrogenase
MLVTEKVGRLRIVRNGTLDPDPIKGIPEVLDGMVLQGLWDVALHPRFAENNLIYFTFAKPNPGENISPAMRHSPEGPSARAVLARGRFDGKHALTNVQELFVSNWSSSSSTMSRIVFAPDGKIFMTIGVASRLKSQGGTARVGTSDDAQNPASHAGKALRLNDDGTVPSDNPFVGKAGYAPEVYAMGFRTPMGLIIHPQTGELWEVEHGPQGGDEVNIIKAGKNYGWPMISLGRSYSGDLTGGGTGPVLAEPCAPGMEQPFLFWVPVATPAGLVIYTGDKFPAWKGNLFTGGLRTAVLNRVVFNGRGLPVQRETLLAELKQRIREVRQGPDGLLYLLTEGPVEMGTNWLGDDKVGALLRKKAFSTRACR